MNLEKLKDSARKFEQKEDWRKAIEVYLKAIQQIESGAETSPDLSLYNRVGDLYLKINDTAAAVRSYERAVDLYADQGFFNNAIALCGKILRVNPGRTQTYLKLAQLHARKNVVIEAKRNLIEFLERMNALSQLDQAFQSVKEFADQFSGSQEIRMMLVDLLRAASREEEALEQLAKIAGDLEALGGPPKAVATVEGGSSAPSPAVARPAAGGRGDLVFLDTGFDLPAAAAGASPEGPAGQTSSSAPAADLQLIVEAPPPDGLELTQLDAVGSEVSEVGSMAPAEPMSGLEQMESADLELGSPEALQGLELDQQTTAGLEFEGVPLEQMEQPEVDMLEAEPVDGLIDAADDLDLALGSPEGDVSASPIDADLDLDFVETEIDEGAPTAGLPLIEASAPHTSAPDLGELEDRIVDDPENPDLHRELADRLLLDGDLPRAAEELRLSLQGYERVEDWAGASGMADRLVALEPDAIHHHQKRVELAFRTGERTPLLDAYLALGEALGRAGATDKALAVYGRVQEHDPENVRASAAIAALTGAPRPHATMAVPAPPAARAAPPPPKEATTPPAAPAEKPPESPRGGGSFVDLGSMILEESTPRDTRMRVERREPQDEDEQREFAEILEQFKRGIEANLDTDDYEAHYDLGVAFKEMGLLDEAIAEFQKALRAPEGRLRTSEALGMAFFEKGQFAVSEAVLRRAVDATEGGDEAKIGLIYWLGRALEAQGKSVDAITSYERAMAVDIRFMDLSDRIHRLTVGRRE
ncbi:MAG TPA: tetratricopeptide repeat protein [Gemmatimonadales bacterium]|nr:tetratricopeptide repeat protein [Gemmatimonadales bacterium]